MLLLVLFQAVILIRLCDDRELCQSFGFDGPFGISIAAACWNLILAVTVLSAIVFRALQTSGQVRLERMPGDQSRPLEAGRGDLMS